MCDANGGQGCCLDIAPRAHFLGTSAWLLHLVGDKAPATARESSEVAVGIFTSEMTDSLGV